MERRSPKIGRLADEGLGSGWPDGHSGIGRRPQSRDTGRPDVPLRNLLVRRHDARGGFGGSQRGGGEEGPRKVGGGGGFVGARAVQGESCSYFRRFHGGAARQS